MNKFCHYKYLLLLIFTILLASCSRPKLIDPRPFTHYLKPICSSFVAEVKLDYCYWLPKNLGKKKSRPIFYAFYQEQGRAIDFFEEGIASEIATTFIKEKGYSPLFISLQFKGSWLLGSGEENLAGKRHKTLMSFFQEVETKLTESDERILFATSIGAINALSLFLRYPHSFSSLAVACPVFFPINPISGSERELADWFKNDQLNFKKSRALFKKVRQDSGLFADEWPAIDPLSLSAENVESVNRRVLLTLSVNADNLQRSMIEILAKNLATDGFVVDKEILKDYGFSGCPIAPHKIAKFVASENN